MIDLVDGLMLTSRALNFRMLEDAGKKKREALFLVAIGNWKLPVLLM